jgi:hypothetical protein
MHEDIFRECGLIHYYSVSNEPIIKLLTNTEELSPCGEAASCAASQKLPDISLSPKVYYCDHKSVPQVSILS